MHYGSSTKTLAREAVRFGALLVVLCMMGGRPVWAAELIPPGSHAKLSAGSGQTVSRGPSALFYNPANLIFSKFVEPQIDVGFASINYSYQHYDVDTYEPAAVALNTPIVTAGFGLRIIPSFAVGVAVLPTGTGAEQLVPNVPIAVTGGTYQLMNVVNKQSGFKIAAGAAFRFAFPLTIGGGLIRERERVQTLLFPVDASGNQAEEAFIDALYGGDFNQFIFGARSEILDRALVLAASFRMAVQKPYMGDILLNLNDESQYEPIDAIGFSPAAIGVGAEGRIGSFALFADFVLEQWSAGRAIYKRGFGPNKDEVDFIDSTHIGAGLKYWLFPKHMLEVAFSMTSANTGDGNAETAAAGSGLRSVAPRPASPSTASQLTQDGEADLTIEGPMFGDLAAIPRMSFSGGYRAKISGNGYFQLGVGYTTGSRIVPEGLEGEGLYSISALVIAGGLAYGF